MHIFTPVCTLLLTLLLTSCATGLKTSESNPNGTFAFQNKALHPANGGLLINGEQLQPGDIVLTASNSLASSGIRLISLSPVSHAAVYMGDQQVAEAVTSGIRRRSVVDLMDEESTIVVFRHPGVKADSMLKMDAFVTKYVGQKYNYLGVMLQAPFSIERRVCELPLVPSLVRDFCIQGVAAIQLGMGRNDQFFCSQFVLEAYKTAGLPLTDADPRLISPVDLLHMREGDVPSIKIRQTLQYVGHLKAPPNVALSEPSQTVALQN
jgi:Permuted papain-like amidase enzyme, YaeF/YiiX, C92 family